MYTRFKLDDSISKPQQTEYLLSCALQLLGEQPVMIQNNSGDLVGMLRAINDQTGILIGEDVHTAALIQLHERIQKDAPISVVPVLCDGRVTHLSISEEL